MDEIVEVVGELIGDAALCASTSGRRSESSGCGPVILITMVVVGLLGAILFIMRDKKQEQIKHNQKRITSIVKDYKKANPPKTLTQPNGEEAGPNDLFDHPVVLSYKVKSDRVEYYCVSGGFDRLLSTLEDNQNATATDLNKSKIAGKWIGTKSKEMFSGLKEGLFGSKKDEE